MGRVWIGWNPTQMDVEVFRLHEQAITVKAKDKGKDVWSYITGIYRHNEGEYREALWQHLCCLNKVLIKEAWMITGDFSIVRNRSERQGGLGINDEEVNAFNSCINSLEMEELPTTGYVFNWNNKMGGMANIQSRIDKRFWKCAVDSEVLHEQDSGLGPWHLRSLSLIDHY